MNLHNELAQNVLIYFVGNNGTKTRNNIVKRHTGDLAGSGDYSFPIEAQKWKQFLEGDLPFFDITIYDYKNRWMPPANQPTAEVERFHQQQMQLLVEHSQQWPWPIERANIQKNRCVLYLNRTIVFRQHLVTVTNNPQYGRQDTTNRVQLRSAVDMLKTPPSTAGLTITQYRRELVERVLVKLLEYSSLDGPENQADQVDMKVAMQSVRCGVAKTPNSEIATADEYLKKRCTDVQLMAQHKYGIRKNKEQEHLFNELIRKLGIAAVTVDLLEVKYSSPVTLSMQNHAGGTSRGATFIMYNSARIETLCATFDDRVRQGYYPPMPDINEIDVALLKEEEEWALMLHYIVDFPNMISRAIGDSSAMAPHLICVYLSGLVGCFSIYYRHRKILTENREHLLPSLYARMALVKCLRIVLNKSMALLNIEPVQHM